jgi:4-amino-4-deoxy-L-arabinose transferase-like glycosyltransferase
LGIDDSVSLDEKMANSGRGASSRNLGHLQANYSVYLIVLLVASAIYLGCIISPPSLMDDIDAVQAQIARNMLSSGDWVTPRLDGIIYLEKPPLIYWLIAGSYKIFGVHDWAARVPVAVLSIALAWLVTAFGIWAFGGRAGFYAGLCMATSIGLFLFTRIQIPDVIQAFTVAIALWAFLRVLDEDETHPRMWPCLLGASLGTGLLLKSLIGVVFPIGTGIIYLILKRQLISRETWRRLRPLSTGLIAIAIAAPWHIMAAIRNPPVFAFTFQSVPGQYHGFLWFFFINEQLLRFLNLRFPRDYNTVPRIYFWLFHLIWLFPWSLYLPAVAKLRFRAENRAARTRLLALCWIGFVLAFFTFSTTQEYYSMPCYPAFALLLGSAMARGGAWVRRGTLTLTIVAGIAALAAIALLFAVRHVPTPGDISVALSRHPKAYTLSLGHMEDLTIPAFAYLRLPLLVAAIAFIMGAIANGAAPRRWAFLSSALMMVLFFMPPGLRL